MYTEKQPWGETKYDVLPNTHTSFQTQKQKVDLISNPHFGRMLFLDGVLQLASVDEHMYHRPFTQNVMKQKQQPRILVAGGADGALLREIQDHDGKYDLGVKEIVLVDWDEELVTYLSNEEPYSRGSLDDPRLVTVFSDIQTYLEKDIPPFDSIFLDLLDPITFDDFEWTKQLLKKSVAKCKGSIGLNAGSDPILVENLVKFCEELGQGRVSTFGEETFPAWNVYIKIVRVPSFQEPWFLLFMEIKNVLEGPEYQDVHKTNQENL